MSVTTMRIDDRLIHGQIVTRWIADAQADTILIADDMAAGDATQQMLLKLVAPANINLLIKTINEAAQLLASSELDDKKVLLMLRNPATALALCNLGFHIDTINVGNISNARSETGRKKLLSFIFVEAQDVECLKALAAKVSIWIFVPYQMTRALMQWNC